MSAAAGTVTLAAGAAAPAISAASGSSVVAGAADAAAAVAATGGGAGAATDAVTLAGTAGRGAMRGGCKAAADPSAPVAGAPLCAHAARPQAASTAKPRRRSGTQRPAQGPGGFRGSRREQAGNWYGNGAIQRATRISGRQGSGGGTVFYQPRPFDRKPGYKIHHTVRRLTIRKTAKMAHSTSENPHLRGAPCRKGHRYNRLAWCDTHSRVRVAPT
ncbi:exported hypothetical protein [Cupriavidus taiwanensis]|nr:exported hypothetical protein [Cupriavidus taiwanensis]SOZ81122.1 exported hypothetical protein [Cupriavidus taiwanensis]SOZ81949.1 exported hypothetical protein [Cupriavidus taiwanensis]SOZ90578.1 exported hypothetical protein [Cupriavidus taiwanensis]